MFTLVFLSVICGSMSAANAITCQSCMEMTSTSTDENFNNALAAATTDACVATGGTTKDCSQTGNGCMNTALTFYYTGESMGDFSISFNMRDCGPDQNMCQGDAAVQQQIDQQKAQLQQMLSGSGVTFNRGEGKVCYCNTGDLCNQMAQEPAAAPTTAKTTTPSGAPHLMASCAATLVAIISALVI